MIIITKNKISDGKSKDSMTAILHRCVNQENYVAYEIIRRTKFDYENMVINGSDNEQV